MVGACRLPRRLALHSPPLAAPAGPYSAGGVKTRDEAENSALETDRSSRGPALAARPGFYQRDLRATHVALQRVPMDSRLLRNTGLSPDVTASAPDPQAPQGAVTRKRERRHRQPQKGPVRQHGRAKSARADQVGHTSCPRCHIRAHVSHTRARAWPGASSPSVAASTAPAPGPEASTPIWRREPPAAAPPGATRPSARGRSLWRHGADC